MHDKGNAWDYQLNVQEISDVNMLHQHSDQKHAEGIEGILDCAFEVYEQIFMPAVVLHHLRRFTGGDSWNWSTQKQSSQSEEDQEEGWIFGNQIHSNHSHIGESVEEEEDGCDISSFDTMTVDEEFHPKRTWYLHDDEGHSDQGRNRPEANSPEEVGYPKHIVVQYANLQDIVNS